MCDILPDSVHSILNDIETGASIPFLLIILFYTLYYAFHHIRNIMCVVKDILRKRACKRRKCPKKPRCPNIIDKIKGSTTRTNERDCTKKKYQFLLREQQQQQQRARVPMTRKIRRIGERIDERIERNKRSTTADDLDRRYVEAGAFPLPRKAGGQSSELVHKISARAVSGEIFSPRPSRRQPAQLDHARVSGNLLHEKRLRDRGEPADLQAPKDSSGVQEKLRLARASPGELLVAGPLRDSPRARLDERRGRQLDDRLSGYGRLRLGQAPGSRESVRVRRGGRPASLRLLSPALGHQTIQRRRRRDARRTGDTRAQDRAGRSESRARGRVREAQENVQFAHLRGSQGGRGAAAVLRLHGSAEALQRRQDAGRTARPGPRLRDQGYEGRVPEEADRAHGPGQLHRYFAGMRETRYRATEECGARFRREKCETSSRAFERDQKSRFSAERRAIGTVVAAALVARVSRGSRRKFNYSISSTERTAQRLVSIYSYIGFATLCTMYKQRRGLLENMIIRRYIWRRGWTRCASSFSSPISGAPLEMQPEDTGLWWRRCRVRHKLGPYRPEDRRGRKRQPNAKKRYARGPI
ncbi:unnamed protein product [Trichogramma brassicae]|uniref:Uncharacterized protein n=1 Tax=Trichogramma brassicae TaxID=86971 RepID=A0A6H5J4P1_9HYME|nr:unnamed protein product [Trichogramma brassicae]